MQRIREMKEDEYSKSFAKHQVCTIIHRLCMKTPFGVSLSFFEGHKYGRRKPTETSVFEFYLCVNYLGGGGEV